MYNNIKLIKKMFRLNIQNSALTLLMTKKNKINIAYSYSFITNKNDKFLLINNKKKNNFLDRKIIITNNP